MIIGSFKTLINKIGTQFPMTLFKLNILWNVIQLVFAYT